MKYYVTIYIDPLVECFMDFKEKCYWKREDFTHAFLGLTKDKSPDELDAIDKEQRQVKFQNKDLKDIDKKWYESLGISEYNDGFWGFGTGTDSIFDTAGKVFDNNQYVMDNNIKTNTYAIKKLRSEQTFKNRCVLEISKEQYETLFNNIKKDYQATIEIKPQTKNPVSDEFAYHIKNNNCVTWVLNKLDSIGIEVIDLKEWIPDNISRVDSLLKKFYYLQFFNAIFLKFQAIDSNLESIEGAKAFRKWTQSMTENKIFCSLKIDGNITQGLGLSTQCKRSITDNIRYYNRIKKTINKPTDLIIIYKRINDQLDRILSKANKLGFNSIKGDFTFILWNERLNKRMLLDSKHRDESTKEYKEYPIESIDTSIPACNWTLNHNASFILVLRDESICRIMYRNYAYPIISPIYTEAINKSHIAILSGKDNLQYWSNSIHKLRKSINQEVFNV